MSASVAYFFLAVLGLFAVVLTCVVRLSNAMYQGLVLELSVNARRTVVV